MLGLKPIKMLPARERVAAALRKAIISRQITEGEVLTLESTAQELGVSITPVREAFQILERDGLDRSASRTKEQRYWESMRQRSENISRSGRHWKVKRVYCVVRTALI